MKKTLLCLGNLQSCQYYYLEKGSLKTSHKKHLSTFGNQPDLGFRISKYRVEKGNRNKLFSTLNNAIRHHQGSERQNADFERAYYVSIMIWVIIKKILDSSIHEEFSRTGLSKYEEILNAIETIEPKLKGIMAFISKEDNSNTDTIFGSQEVNIIDLIDLIEHGNHKKEIALIVMAFLKNEASEDFNFLSKPFQNSTNLESQSYADIADILEGYIQNPNENTLFDDLKKDFCCNTINLTAAFSVYWLEREKRAKKRITDGRENEYEKINLGSFF